MTNTIKQHIQLIDEMAFPLVNMDVKSAEYVVSNKHLWKDQGSYIADIEQFRVVELNAVYSLWDQNEVIACATILNNSLPTVTDVWVKEELRGQKIFSKMLWFFKTRLGYTNLLLGNSHSPTMQEVIKGLSFLQRCWYNPDTNVKEPYDIATVEKYYQYPFDEWHILIEHAEQYNWPMFNGNGFIYENYSAYVGK